MKDLINEITSSNKEIYFVSPHFDDAVISCGELMIELSKRKKINVINVFTKAESNNSISARKNLSLTHSKSGIELYEKRILEDKKALNNINAKQTNLDFVECLWRRKEQVGFFENLLSKYIPELTLIYPIYRLHALKGKISEFDAKNVEKIAQKIKEIVPEGSYIFCPLGIGNHVDHIITKEAVERNFNPIYWLDQPYAKYLKFKNYSDFDYKRIHSIKKAYNKNTLIKKYESQIQGILKKGKLPNFPESYYKRPYSVKVHSNLDGKLEQKWNNLWEEASTSHYFNSLAWFKTLENVFPEGRYLIFELLKNNKTIGLITLEEKKMFGRKFYITPGNKFNDRCSLLLEDIDPETLSSFIKIIRKHGDLILSEVPEDIYNILPNNFIKNSYKSSTNLILPFENNPFRFMDGKKRRKITKVFDANPESFEFVMGRGDKNLFKTAIKIDKVSYKENKNIGTFGDQMNLNFFTKMIEMNKNEVGINILYFKKQAIAYEIGIRSKETYYGLNKSFDNNYKHLTPGKINSYLLFKGLQKEGIKVFDMARGDDMLKRSYTKIQRAQYDLLIMPYILAQALIFKRKIINILLDSEFFYKNYRKLKSYI